MAQGPRLLPTLVLVWACCSGVSWAFSRGAPDTACSTLVPQHSGGPQSSASPFTITPGAVEVAQGVKMLVTLEAPNGDTFKGFIIQAKASDSEDLVGTFFTTDHSYLTCGKGFNNAVTHNSPSPKRKVMLEWEPPSDYEGDVVFSGSFVRSYTTFWVGVTSEKVTVTKRSVPVTTETVTTPTTTATTTTVAPDVSPDVELFPVENVGDEVISVVDAPSVDVVENTLDEAGFNSPTTTPIGSSPTTPSFPTDSPNSTVSVVASSPSTEFASTTEDYYEPLTDAPTTRPPRRRLGIFGRFKTTTTLRPTTVKATTTTTTRRSTEGLSIVAQSLQGAMEDIYLGCGIEKGCFGFPDNCIDKENCKILMTYTKVQTGYKFELTGSTGGTGYVAGGLSDDNKMGSDSVMACRNLNGEVDVLMAYNNENYNNELLTESRKGLTDIKTIQVDGEVYCSFIRQTVTEIKGINFDLEKDRYHLMVAKGPAFENGLRFHEARTISSGTSSMNQFQSLAGSSFLYRKLHACFMIGAWICAASCGILLARYYKQTWLKSKCCGVDQWFHFHRFFMGLTWGLTMAGVALIAYDLKGWTKISPKDNPHAILGVVSTGLCFIQPFMALCRCGPTHKRRPVFNWLHWFVGNSAQIVGIAAIFFGLELVKAPRWTMFIMIIFIAFHCIVHLILSVGQCVSDSKQEKQNNVFPMKELNGSGRNAPKSAEKRTDAPGATFRKTMLTFYFIGNWLVTAVLILIVAVGEETLKDWNLIFWEE